MGKYTISNFLFNNTTPVLLPVVGTYLNNFKVNNF